MSDNPFSSLSLRAQNVLERLDGLEPRDKQGLIEWWQRQQDDDPDGPRRVLMAVQGCGVTVYAEILRFISADPNLEAIKRDVHEVFKDSRTEYCCVCSFWDGNGLCRRYPRTASVSPDHWCGEYQAVETA